LAPPADQIPTLHDPLAEAASIPPEMVAAAFSSPDGTVRVLAGTALEAWASTLVTAHFDAVRPAWAKAAADLAAQAVRAATEEQVARWSQQLEAARWPGTPAAIDPSEESLVRRNTWVPRGLAATFKASASAQGLTQQQAFTEALLLWVTASQRRGPEVA
jgi:hypothetical protein